MMTSEPHGREKQGGRDRDRDMGFGFPDPIFPKMKPARGIGVRFLPEKEGNDKWGFQDPGG